VRGHLPRVTGVLLPFQDFIENDIIRPPPPLHDWKRVWERGHFSVNRPSKGSGDGYSSRHCIHWAIATEQAHAAKRALHGPYAASEGRPGHPPAQRGLPAEPLV
jgi:hypothetical protein